EQSRERSEERPQAEDAEDDAGLGRRAGQRLHPHGKRDEHRPVAEGGQRLPREEQTRVAVRKQRLHQAARNTRTPPLIGLPRTTPVGLPPWLPATGSLPSATSDVRSPEVDPASTSRSEPAAIPISISPETLENLTSPALTPLTRMSPETDFALTSPPTGP